MMSIFKKKKYRFQVDFLLEELSDVPFINATLFAKMRLLDGGSFCDHSPRVSVLSNRVCWNKSFSFTCKISENPQTRVLEQCMCRVSVRKELKGGRSYQKLGFVDINLSEFAGSGAEGQSRSFLLDGYSSAGHQRDRQDNSRLRVKISMNLSSADPFFKVPIQPSESQSGQLDPEDRKGPSASPALQLNSQGSHNMIVEDGQSVNSGSSGIGSSKDPHHHEEDCSSMPGHSRNASQTSQSSGCPPSQLAFPMGANPCVHSRQSSIGEGGGGGGLKARGHERRPSSDKIFSHPSTGGKVGSTRVNAALLIDEIIKDGLRNTAPVQPTAEEDENPGLALFVSTKDGTATVGSHDIGCRGSGFEKVVIPIDTDEIR